jgi:UDP-glucose 4-epimerase
VIKKKILVTGGAGFIGSYLVNKLIKNNFHVMVVDNLTCVGGIPFINKKSYFVKGDFRTKSTLKKIEIFSPEIIFHLAAQSAGEPAYDDPKKDLLNNGYGTYLLCELAKKIKVKLFIYASSVAIYGSKLKGSLDEKELPNPDSIYGISKYLGEMYVQLLCKTTKTKFLIFRIFNTYGPGENLNYQKKGMVSIYASHIWKNKPILVKGSLDRFRDFTYITDTVNFIYQSIYQKKLNQVYNLSSGKKTSVKDLIKTLLAKFNKKKKYSIKILNNTSGDSFGFHSSNKKILKDFKVKFNFKLKEGLDLYVSWIKIVPKLKNLKKFHPFYE